MQGSPFARVSRSFKHVDEDSNDPKYFVEESG